MEQQSLDFSTETDDKKINWKIVKDIAKVVLPIILQ